MVSVLLNGPILYAAFGYWMYSNPQIMFNEVEPIYNAHDVTPVKRQFGDIFTKLTPGTLYLVLLVIAIFAKVDHHIKLTEKYIFGES